MGETNEIKKARLFGVMVTKKSEGISKEDSVNTEFPHCYVKYEYEQKVFLDLASDKSTL